MKNPYQYSADIKDNNRKHDWYFEYANCECGPFHGRDTARKILKSFKNDYAKLLKTYHGGNPWVGIYAD